MKKLIDKLLYFFGYAPVKISHEVRNHYVYKESKLDIIREVKDVEFTYMTQPYYRECLERRAIQDIKVKILDNLERYIQINKITTSESDSVRYVAEICVGRINN